MYCYVITIWDKKQADKGFKRKPIGSVAAGLTKHKCDET